MSDGAHNIWYPLFDTPITVTMSREQLQSVADELRGVNVFPGWAEHFASQLAATLAEPPRAEALPDVAIAVARMQGELAGSRASAATVTLVQDWQERNETNMSPALAMELREILTLNPVVGE